MAVFGQYDIDGLKRLHMLTVCSLYQHAHRIEGKRLRYMAYSVLHGTNPKTMEGWNND